MCVSKSIKIRKFMTKIFLQERYIKYVRVGGGGGGGRGGAGGFLLGPWNILGIYRWATKYFCMFYFHNVIF